MRVGHSLSLARTPKLSPIGLALRLYPFLPTATRTGLATCIGPDGTVQWGPHNLLSESGNLLDAVWTKINGGAGAPPLVTAGFTDPDNGNTAYRLQLNAGGSTGADYSILRQATAALATHLRSTWVKSNTGLNQIIYLGALASNQAVTATPTWQRLSNLYTPAASTFDIGCYPQAAGTAQSADLLIWHPHLENVTGTNRTTPSPYVDTTVLNRLGYSNDFVNAAWTKAGLTPYEKTGTGPSGQPATTLVATANGGTIAQTLTLAGVYTAGLLIRRRSGTGTVALRSSNNASWVNQTITTDWALCVNDAGTSGGTAYCSLQIGTSGDQIDICDARLVPGASAATYAYNPYAAPAVGPVYLARTDYDPVTLVSKGQLIEGQATQLLAYPDDLTVAPWTGSATATNDGKTYRGRVFWKLTKTLASGSENRATTAAGGAQAAGYYTQRVALLASSNSSQIAQGLLGGTSTWGANADTTGYIESGPGSLSQSVGGLWLVTGLSTTTPTVVVLTRNLLVSETIGLFIYPDSLSSTTIGRAGYVQCDNLEPGKSPTSYIPNASTSAVTRLADTALVPPDTLYKALPWLMDSNLLVSPDVPTTQSVTTTAQQYTVQMQGTGTCTLSGTATGTLTGTGLGNVVTLTVTATAGTLTLTFAGSNINGKINPGPVAQTYYPQSTKQATIVVDADLTYGAASGGMTVASFENTASNRALIYKAAGGSLLYGYVNANNASPGSISSGVGFKAAIGFGPSSAGVVLNSGAETAITASSFAAMPNVLKIGTDAGGNTASSMHLRSLRVFNKHFSAAIKQGLTQ